MAETKTEIVLFIMPVLLEALLAAIAVVQAYRNMHPEIVVHAVFPEQWIDYSPALGAFTRVFDSTPRRGIYDLVFQFDPDVAYEIAKHHDLLMVQGFGLQLGLDPSVVPDLSMLKVPAEPEPIRNAILLVDDFIEGDKVLIEMLKDAGQENGYEVDTLAVLGTGLEPHCELSNIGQYLPYCMIIGQQTPITYLALALGKAVVEIVRPTKHRNWLAKWNCPGYEMIYSDSLRVGMVVNSVNALWHRYCKPLLEQEAISVQL